MELGRKKKVLFICTGNSCRSQMAEGLLRSKHGDRYEAFSAGTHPSRVHPMAVKAMAEWEIDISMHSSDHIELYLDQGIDIVITVCDAAKEICPVFPENVEQIHWSIPDPFHGWTVDDKFIQQYRHCRNMLREFIDNFAKSKS